MYTVVLIWVPKNWRKTRQEVQDIFSIQKGQDSYIIPSLSLLSAPQILNTCQLRSKIQDHFVNFLTYEVVLSLPFSSYIKWKLYFISHADSFDLFKERQNTSTQERCFPQNAWFPGFISLEVSSPSYAKHPNPGSWWLATLLWIQKNEKPADYMNRSKGRIKYNTRAGSRITVYGLTFGIYLKRNTTQIMSLGTFLNRLSLYNARAGALYISTWRNQTWTIIFNANV